MTTPMPPVPDERSFVLVSLRLKEANEFVNRHHRHHKEVPSRNHRFSIGLSGTDGLVGVAVCGKPLAPSRNDGRTLEVHRVCTDGTKNACSFLLGACRRAAFEMGYRRIGTYTIPAEGGAAMRAAGWGEPRETRGGRWTNREGRRENKDADGVTKWIWEAYNERPRMMKLKT